MITREGNALIISVISVSECTYFKALKRVTMISTAPCMTARMELSRNWSKNYLKIKNTKNSYIFAQKPNSKEILWISFVLGLIVDNSWLMKTSIWSVQNVSIVFVGYACKIIIQINHVMRTSWKYWTKRIINLK